jgi:integrase
VADVIRRYRDTVVPAKQGREIETIILNAFLRHKLASTRLSELNASQIGAYRDERLKRVKPATIGRELGLLQHAFEIARREWAIPRFQNPVVAVRKPTLGNRRNRRLKAGELDRLRTSLGKCRNRLIPPLVALALETGMRRGELLNACWSDLSTGSRTLHIPVTKNGESRTIPLSSAALDTLHAIKDSGLHDGERIFPLSKEAVRMAWDRATIRAGLGNLHLHDLRHEAISRFFEKGLTVPEVSLISGHRDPRMLFRYTHLRAEDVVAKLD